LRTLHRLPFLLGNLTVYPQQQDLKNDQYGIGEYILVRIGRTFRHLRTNLDNPEQRGIRPSEISIALSAVESDSYFDLLFGAPTKATGIYENTSKHQNFIFSRTQSRVPAPTTPSIFLTALRPIRAHLHREGHGVRDKCRRTGKCQVEVLTTELSTNLYRIYRKVHGTELGMRLCGLARVTNQKSLQSI